MIIKKETWTIIVKIIINCDAHWFPKGDPNGDQS